MSLKFLNNIVLKQLILVALFSLLFHESVIAQVFADIDAAIIKEIERSPIQSIDQYKIASYVDVQNSDLEQLDKYTIIKSTTNIPLIPKWSKPHLIYSAEVYFELDSSALTHSGLATIDKLEKYILDQSDNIIFPVLILGYSDRLGDSNYNKKLSLERANRVKDNLAKNFGIPNQFIVKAMGEKNHEASLTEEFNRKVVVQMRLKKNTSEVIVEKKPVKINKVDDRETQKAIKILESYNELKPTEKKKQLIIKKVKNLKAPSGITLSINSLHSDLKGSQKAGAGVGTTATGLLSTPKASLKFEYERPINDLIGVGVFTQFRWFEHDAQLLNQVVFNQNEWASRFGLTTWWYINPNVWSVAASFGIDEQLFYYGDSGGRLIFDSEGKFRFAVKSRMNLVKNRFTDLDFLAEVAYSLPQELTEEGLTYRFALDSFFLLKKMIGIHLNYEMNQFKTTTSEQDQEVLEFGAAIKF